MSTLPAPPLPRLALIDRSQLLLHTVDVERLIDEDHSARSIWHLVGRMNLSLYHAKIAALEGRAGRDHTAPQLLISLWLYGYSQGISSAREIARQCAFEPGFAWLCGLQPISHRTLSGFRSDHKEALENLFVQVVGMLSAEGLITMQRVTLDGTKIKANASGNTFRRKEKIEAHLALAREQVQKMNEQAAEEEKAAKRQSAAKRRAARQRVSRLEAAFREVERLQESKKHDRDNYVARASTTDPEAHVMRNGEGGTVPSYNVQLVTDTTHGLIVNVEATTDAIDYRQLEPALNRCQETVESLPKQIVADGDYTNHASVQAAESSKVDFYGSWQDSWKPTEHDAHGRSGAFISSAFPYDAQHDVYLCPAGKPTHSPCCEEQRARCAHAGIQSTQSSMPLLSTAGSVRSQEEGTQMGALPHSQRGSCCDDRFQSQDGNRRGKNNLPPKVADRGVPARLDKRTMCTPAISMPRTREDIDGSYLGLP